MKAQKAIVAVAGRLLKVVYKTLESLTMYKEKGIAYFVNLQAKATLYYKVQQQYLSQKALHKVWFTRFIFGEWHLPS